MAIYDPRRRREQRENRSPQKPRANMHEGVGDWCDCCICEAEPMWEQVAQEMGISLSDYEDEV